MKQVVQSLKSGTVEVPDVPVPRCRRGELLIEAAASLVSAGTERMMLEFGRGSALAKARQQPDKVRQVLDKARTDGVATTLDAVRRKLDEPHLPGYCHVGRVLEVGEGCAFELGERVVSNGHHAEVVAVPENLCAGIPDAVSDEAAAFTVLGAIALQGVRLINPTLGEGVVVMGLGLIGLLTVQLLRANGCRVLGVDFDPVRLKLAADFGAATVNAGDGEQLLRAAQAFSRGTGVDAVIITAATSSNEPMSQAARMSRKRGRIVLVGVTGLELSRADFYEKELSFQVSCSYGPGRYDPNYEGKGLDYPIGFVRWTEQRNFEAVLDLMAAGSLVVAPLISHRFPIDKAPEAYDLVASGEPTLGILFDYDGSGGRADTVVIRRDSAGQSVEPVAGRVRLGFIGAGNYAGAMLLPAFAKTTAELGSIASAGGLSAVHLAKKFDIAEATTAADTLVDKPELSALVISTRHDSHAYWVRQALAAGKPVFVEKPLCLSQDELSSIEAQLDESPGLLMVGFNRRFSPLLVQAKTLLESCSGSKLFVMTVNAGEIPADHWTQDPEVGGGRIIGECCHFIDLLRHLAGSPIKEWSRSTMDSRSRDTVTISLAFEDGSLGTIHYLANGHRRIPKERLEVYCDGRVLQLDNFRVLKGFGWPGFRRQRLWRQDKGQKACAAAFVEAIANGGPSPVPLDEILEVSRRTIEIATATG